MQRASSTQTNFKDDCFSVLQIVAFVLNLARRNATKPFDTHQKHNEKPIHTD